MMKRMLFWIMMSLFFIGCKDDVSDMVDINRPIDKITEGYYKVTATEEDTELMFKRLDVLSLFPKGTKDSDIVDRWCAFIGDSIIMLNGAFETKQKNGEERKKEAFVCCYFHDRKHIFLYNQPNAIRLMQEKAAFDHKGTTVIPMRSADDEILLTVNDAGCKFRPGVFLDYIWDYDNDLMVYHYADGNYYVSRITISGNEVPFNPLHKDDVLLRWSSGSWLVLGGNKDFEDDGAIDISFYPCNSDDPISSYSVHLTWEALYELEQNNGKTIRKYWNVVNRDTDHASYEFVVEYPNGHEYKMSFEAKGVLSFTKSSVTWLGESYSLLPVYSDLPCRFTTTWWDLWHESSQKTIFTEVTTHMKTDGTQELCFKDENTTFYYPMEDSFNYLIGQDNMLIIGQSYLYTNTNGMPELNIYPVFHHLMIYDGVCPNCLESKSRMAIDFHECISKCSKCGRWYDLSNYGVIIRGSGGKALIRYPAFRNTELNRIEI